MIIIPQITHFYNWIFIILRISKNLPISKTEPMKKANTFFVSAH